MRRVAVKIVDGRGIESLRIVTIAQGVGTWHEEDSPQQSRPPPAAGCAGRANRKLRRRARGAREPAKKGRSMCRLNFQYNRAWRGRHYAIKQVAPVIAERPGEIVVVTVYTFFF